MVWWHLIICPNLFECQDFSKTPRTFGHKWNLSSTIMTCPNFSGRIKFPKCPNFSSIRIFPESSKCFGQNRNFFNHYNIIGHCINSKNCPKVLERHGKKFSQIFLEHQDFFWVPNFFEKKWKFSRHKNSQTVEIFSQEFSRGAQGFGQHGNCFCQDWWWSRAFPIAVVGAVQFWSLRTYSCEGQARWRSTAHAPVDANSRIPCTCTPAWSVYS